MSNARIITVATLRPDEIPAYLQGSAEITGPRYTAYRATILFLAVATDESDFRVQGQVDRLNSGMHGARGHTDMAAAQTWLAEAYGNDLVEIAPVTV